MLYRKIIGVCSEICTKHTNALCGQKAEFLHIKPIAYKISNGL